MSNINSKLPLDGNCTLLNKIATDYGKLVEAGAEEICANRLYKVECSSETAVIIRSARKTVFSGLTSGFKKVAFDTRRTDREERNPRSNLQHWTRSASFTPEEDQKQINAFSKLVAPLSDIKKSFDGEQDYFKSFARELHDNVNRVLRLDIKDGDTHYSQLNYLEQLLFARYRLSVDNILAMGEIELKNRILEKDETLMKRGVQVDKNQIKSGFSVDVSKNGMATQENIINAIFGASVRKAGEKNVERTVTITIRDTVLDDNKEG